MVEGHALKSYFSSWNCINQIAQVNRGLAPSLLPQDGKDKDKDDGSDSGDESDDECDDGTGRGMYMYSVFKGFWGGMSKQPAREMRR